MKKNVILGLLALSISFTACNKSDASGVKIDFTKSYEDAASALEVAQKNYAEALKSMDQQKIEDAKIALENAQQKYASTKADLLKDGGKVNQTYEKVFNDTKAVVTSTAASTTENVQSGISNAGQEVVDKAKTELNKQVDQQVENVNSQLKNTTDKAKADLQKKVDQSKEEVQKNIDKTKADLKAKNDEAKKSVDNEVKKAQDKLNKFLDNN